MKTSDYVTVAFVAIFITALSYYLVNSILGDPTEKSITFEYLDSYNSELATPDSEIFNAAAINPTVEVYVGSCVDQNQDGILDDDEKRACGSDFYQTDDDDGRSSGGYENGDDDNGDNGNGDGGGGLEEE